MLIIKYRRKLYRLYPLLRHNFGVAISLLIGCIILLFLNVKINYPSLSLKPNVELYQNRITIWSSDYHISPIYDLKSILNPFGVYFIDKSLSDNCHDTNSCAENLHILSKLNGINLDVNIRRRFYDYYKNHIEMNMVDAFVCFHPTSMCELYMPFNRSIIVIASTRYELGRFESYQWKQWNDNLKAIAKNPKNLVAANNLYDAEYIRYFTGLKVTLLPSFCGYANAHYNPTRTEFLLAPIHARHFEPIFLKKLVKSLDRFGSKRIVVARTKDLYKHYEYADLASHRAIIHVPYQVSIMSLFEQFRMCIPLFVPSLELLTRWQCRYGVVNERTWDNIRFDRKSNGSLITGMLTNIPDPNNDYNYDAIRYWLNFSDFYQWPHIIYYHSTDDLVKKLLTTNFDEISLKMKSYNMQLRYSLLKKWNKMLKTIKQYSKKFF